MRLAFSIKFFNTLVDYSWIIEQLYKLVAMTSHYWHRDTAKTVASAPACCTLRPVVCVTLSEEWAHIK